MSNIVNKNDGIKSKFTSILNEKHSGFAITIEVIVTLAMCCIFLTCTLYILKVMNVQRYMNTVMTSTATQASRWGGVNTKTYRNNVSSTSLINQAQSQLDLIASNFNPKITGSPNTIASSNQKITIKIEYSLPNAFEALSTVNNTSGSYDMYTKTRDMNMQISVYSIMEPGKLL